MAMGSRRKRERHQDLWIATSDVVETPANAFYDRLGIDPTKEYQTPVGRPGKLSNGGKVIEKLFT